MASALEAKAVVAKYFTKKRMCANAEIGLRSRREGAIRADILAMSMSQEIIVVEIKSSVADFRSDKKMHLYLDYCNKAYLACSLEVYKKIKADIHPGFGVMIIGEKSVRVIKNAKRRDMDPEIRMGVIMRLVFRNAEYNRFKKRRKAL
ncbi:hypothetical protein [Achromobacter phage Motura]|uniref:Uncharacterized protein n=1 Tax=Achromobacter phage Motura TaxID=2591403 RepID=A0A514CSF6_9CAUD|nr:hypothetical protein H1O15_gp062 [Achromobacter phage Motura]QDH83400.1 hypothetical protein [Achromobacter phage Motura]